MGHRLRKSIVNHNQEMDYRSVSTLSTYSLSENQTFQNRIFRHPQRQPAMLQVTITTRCPVTIKLRGRIPGTCTLKDCHGPQRNRHWIIDPDPFHRRPMKLLSS